MVAVGRSLPALYGGRSPGFLRAQSAVGTAGVRRLDWLWVWLGLALGGASLLTTFIALGRPPLSPPTFAGILTFIGLFSLLTAVAGAFAVLTARAADLSRRDGWRLAAAGASPLALGWPLAGVLYVPEVHHWFANVESVRPAMAIALVLPTGALSFGLALFAARERVMGWCWRHRFVLAGSVYAGAALAAKPSLWHIDLPGWFVPAAKLVLAGQPLAMYSVRADVMGTAAPLEHGPLTVLLYAPFVALAEAAGKTDFLRVGALFPLLGVLALDCAMARQATHAIRDLVPRADERHLFGTYCLILFSPLLWFSSVWLVHLESLNALLVIGALRLLARGRGGWAGACLGAALLLKHSAALAAGPVLLALCVAGQRRDTLVAGATAALVAGAGLLPFAVAAPADFAYNFAGYDAVKPIYGLTIWKASYDSGLEPLIMRLDSVLVAAIALGSAAAAAVVLTRHGVDRRALAWIAVVLGQVAWLALATWQYPHYFVLGFVALLIWETSWGANQAAQSHEAREAASAGFSGWPVLALLFLFVPYNLQAHFPGNVGKAGGTFVVVRAAAQVVFLYGVALAVWIRAASAGCATRPSALREAPPPHPA